MLVSLLIILLVNITLSIKNKKFMKCCNKNEVISNCTNTAYCDPCTIGCCKFASSFLKNLKLCTCRHKAKCVSSNTSGLKGCCKWEEYVQKYYGITEKK